MPGLFDFTRNPEPAPPPVSPETVQAHVSAVQTVRQAKARRNDGATGMARASAYDALHARLRAEREAGWRA